MNKPSCSGVNINNANNILEHNSISGLTVEIQTLREENERLKDQVRDFQAQDKAQDFVQHVLSTDKLCNHHTGLSLDTLFSISWSLGVTERTFASTTTEMEKAMMKTEQGKGL